MIESIADNKNGDAIIYLDKDKMKAFLEITPPAGEGLPCDMDRVRAVLNEAKVVHGIDESKLEEALLQMNWGQKIQVAQGNPAIDGQNAVITLKYLATENKLAPTQDDKGNVNYREMGLVHNVQRGEELATRIAPVPGIKGKDVQGRELLPRAGKDIPLPRGKNTVCNADNTSLYATLDGHITMIDRKLTVQPVFELNGDVDFSSGNIDFIGDVVIRGSVTGGFTVRAAGNIEVTGFVEGAEVIAGGSITVKGGIKSSYKGIVKAAESISVRFVENSRLEAGQDVIVREAIMQSYVRAGGNVIVSDRKATIVGGLIQAAHTVEAKIIGSQLATQTNIEVGVNPYHREELQILLKARSEAKKQLDNISNNLQIFQRAGLNVQDLPETKRLALINMLDEFKSLKNTLAEQEVRIKLLEEELHRASSARVRALEIAYPGVKISIGSSVYTINDAVKFSQFVLEEGEVRLAALT